MRVSFARWMGTRDERAAASQYGGRLGRAVPRRGPKAGSRAMTSSQAVATSRATGPGMERGVGWGRREERIRVSTRTITSTRVNTAGIRV